MAFMSLVEWLGRVLYLSLLSLAAVSLALNPDLSLTASYSKAVAWQVSCHFSNSILVVARWLYFSMEAGWVSAPYCRCVSKTDHPWTSSY